MMLESSIHAQQGNMLLTVSFKHIIDHLIPVFPAEVNIKIRWTCAVRIQEAFKIKIQVNWVDVCYLQTISNNRICTAATTNIKKTAALCISDDIPGDEEIGIKPKFVYNF